MTTELEQEFFKVFGIKKSNCNCPMLDKNNCIFVPSECNYYQYPEITDRVLLELICCVPKTVLNNCTTIKEIEEAVLKDLILCTRKYTAQELKHQIQQLFKGEPMSDKEIINGIDVSESVLTATNNDVYYSQKAVDELQNTIKHLQEENEGLKSLNDFNVQKIEVLQEENERLKQALEEIREITEQDRNCMNSELACCRLCDKLDLIKEKTNEVLNDRD